MINYLTLAIIFLSFVVSTIAYPHLPNIVASHWDIRGNVNGFMPHLWGTYGLPLLMLAIYLLLKVFMRFDPMKKNIKLSQKSVGILVLAIIVFMAYIHVLTLAWNLGYQFYMGSAVVIGLSILFFIVGTRLPYLKPNWTIGIRTPWTLSNPEVWKKTHNLGGVVFKYGSVLMLLLAILFPVNPFRFLFVLIILMAFIPVVYSFLLYSKASKS